MDDELKKKLGDLRAECEKAFSKKDLGKIEELTSKLPEIGRRLAVCVPITGMKSHVNAAIVELARAGQMDDIHKWTLEHDEGFNAAMRARDPNWDSLPFEERRKWAKTYNFARMYSAHPNTEPHPQIFEESEITKKQRAFDLAWARMKARRDGKECL